ncbi:MAG: HAD family hydrolase [Candidatus Acidiferrales bacterium]
MTCPQSIAAFFDLDGTLLPPPSLELRFALHLFRRHPLALKPCLQWLAHLAGSFACSPRRAVVANKFYLAGMSAQSIEALVLEFSREPLPFYREALRRLAWHFAHGHQIFLVSGTLAILARAVARQLAFPVAVCATELEFQSGRCTGRIAGEHISGAAKARALARLATLHGLDLRRSFAYGNSISDAAMLSAVGLRAAVNPSPRLERLARQRGWPILEWRSTESAAIYAPAALHSPLARPGR